MSGLTATQALYLLETQPSQYATAEALRDLARQVSIDSPGKVTVLYSGVNGSGISGGDIVKGMVAQGDDVRAISRTHAYQFLDSKVYQEAVAKVFDTPVSVLNDPDQANHPGNKFINDAKTGVWAEASVRFVAGAMGDVRVIAPFSDPGRILALDEIPALLKNSNVTSINGIQKSVFQNILDRTGSLAEVNKAVASSSYVLMREMSLDATVVLGTNGQPVLNKDLTIKMSVDRVNSSTFLEGSGSLGTRIPGNDVSMQSSMDNWARTDSTRSLALMEGAKSIDLTKIVQGASHVLGGVGILATAYDIWKISQESKAAYDDGDNFKAAEIVARGAAEIGTGWAVGVGASQLAATFLTPLLPLGPVGVVIGAIAAAGVGILAAWGGTVAVRSFLDAATGNPIPAESTVSGWKIISYQGGVEIREAVNGGQGGVDKIWTLPNPSGGTLQIEQNSSTGGQTRALWAGTPGQSDLLTKTVTLSEAPGQLTVQTTTYDKASGGSTSVVEHKVVSDGALLDSTTTVFNRDGLTLSQTWDKADGSHGSYTANPDTGSSVTTVVNVDRSTDILAIDSRGSKSSERLDAQGRLIERSWDNWDGTKGSEKINPLDGSITGVTIDSDGNATQYWDDNQGNRSDATFDKDQLQTGASWRTADGSHGNSTFSNGIETRFATDGRGNEQTARYDGSRFLDRSWKNADGSHGTYGEDSFGGSYGDTYLPDGSLQRFTMDARGNLDTRFYAPWGTLTGRTWTSPDGSRGSENIDGQKREGVVTYIDGSKKTYSDDGQGNVTSKTFYPGGAPSEIDWWRSDGSRGSEKIDINGGRIGVVYSRDQQYTRYTNDGQGNTTDVAYTKEGEFKWSEWKSADGSSGGKGYTKDGSLQIFTRYGVNGRDGAVVDTYRPNGMIHHDVYNRDRTEIRVVDDGQGERIETSWGPGGRGVVSNKVIKYNADGSGTITTTDASGTTQVTFGPGGIPILVRPEVPSDSQRPEEGLPEFLIPFVMDTSIGQGDPSDFLRSPLGEDPEQRRDRMLDGVRKERLAAEQIFKTVISPLVLDLDGDGVETVSVKAGIHFDHDGNGFKELTGWVVPDDGLLVLDRNGNGQVDDGGELFGSYTITQAGTRAPNGFIALAEFDANRDRQVNALDPIFDSLRIWQDLNQDGASQANEWSTLQEKGVAALFVDYETSNKVDSQGNERRQIGQYLKSDGTIAQLHDVWLERNSGAATRESAPAISQQAQVLPEIQGFGSLQSLRQAMSEDAVLLGHVRAYMDEVSVVDRNEMLDLIIMRWTGADRVVFGIDSPYYDERKLFAIDAASGESAYNRNYNERPFAGPQADIYIEAGYALLRTYVGEELGRDLALVSQQMLQSRFDDSAAGLRWELKGHETEMMTDPQSALASLLCLVQSSGPELLAAGWDGYEVLRREIEHASTVPELAAFMREALNIVQGSGRVDPISATAPAVIMGSAGNDTLVGGQLGHSVFFADEGNDEIVLRQSDALVTGAGKGNDIVYARDGARATVIFDASVSPDDIDVSVSSEDLIFSFNTGETLTFDNWLYDVLRGDESGVGIGRWFFADGTVWHSEDIDQLRRTSDGDDEYLGFYLPQYIDGKDGNDRLSGGSGSDVIVGGAGSDSIDAGDGSSLLFGNEGNDYINGGPGYSHDFLVGGAGDDMVSASGGDDVFYFERGFGSDTLESITWQDSSRNVIIFGPGLDVDDVRISRPGSSFLSISFLGSDDHLVINGLFNSPQGNIRYFLFDDGTLLSKDQLLALPQLGGTDGDDQLWAIGNNPSVLSGGGGTDVIVGSDSADVLWGEGGEDELRGGLANDTLVGGVGDDWLSGGKGSDTYVFALGDGVDVINDDDGTYSNADKSTIVLNMRPDQVLIKRGGYNHNSLVLEVAAGVANGSQSIEISSWFKNDDISDSLQVKFADGTIWTSQYLWQNAVAPAGAAAIYGTPEGENIIGDTQANQIWGGAGADTLYGGSGRDLIEGGTGDDVYLFKRGMGQDEVWYDAGGIDTILVEAGISLSDLTIDRQGAKTIITLNQTNDRLVDHQGQEESRIEFLKFANGTVIDLLANDQGSVIGTGNSEDVNGTKLNERLEGLEGNDKLSGYGGNDLLIGGSGADTLFGNGGDTLQGGIDRDEINLDDDDVALYDIGDGHDVIYAAQGSVLRFGLGIKPSDVTITSNAQTSLTIAFSKIGDSIRLPYWFDPSRPDASFGNIEFADGTKWTLQDVRNRGNLGVKGYGTGAGDVLNSSAPSVWGGPGDDLINNSFSYSSSIYGGSGNDTMKGSSGSNIFYGGEGDDTYVFDRGFGKDTIEEPLGLGESSDNRIVFGEGISSSEIIVTGDNQFTPGSSNNLYLSIFGTTDRITLSHWFNPNQSNVNTVQFEDGTIWNRAQLLQRFYALERGGRMYGTDHSETIKGDGSDDQLEGLGGNDLLEGAGGRDELFGGEGDDTLSGGRGEDLLLGGIGNDTYLYGRGDGLDRITDTDRVSGGHDRLVLREGIAPADVVVRRQDDDVVLEIGGRDAVAGDAIHIRWYGSEALKIESVVFYGGQVWSAAQLQAMADAHVVIRGTGGADALLGSSGAENLIGGDGADTLNGGQGNDTLVGGNGDDRYQFTYGMGIDAITEAAGTAAGVDTIEFANGILTTDLIATRDATTATIRLATGEQVKFYPNAIELLVFNDGSTVLDAAGINTLFNKAPTGSVTLTGTAIQGQILTATNTVADVDGLGAITYQWLRDGAATGSAGATFTLGQADVGKNISVRAVYIDALGTTEAVTSAQTNAVMSAGVNLGGGSGSDVLQGGIGNDTLFGYAGDDWLLGAQGADSLVGGDGSDLYTVDNSADVVVETFDINNAMAGGDDTVYATADYVLPSNVETLILEGDADLNAWSNNSGGEVFGNDGDNHIYGGDWDDFLSGGYGVDTLSGGNGDDFYELLDGGDVIVEAADGGYDFIWTYTSSLVVMSEHVEELVHMMPSYVSLNAVGNAQNNVITGSNGTSDRIRGGAGNDTIKARGGNDTLYGDVGNDSLEGGSGSDSYFFSRGGGRDRILDSQISATVTAVDKLTFEGDIDSSQLWFQRQLNDLVVTVIGETDGVTVRGWYANNNVSANYQIEQIKTSGDGKTLTNTKVDQLVQAMSAFTPPPVGQTELSASQLAALTPVLAAAWV